MTLTIERVPVTALTPYEKNPRSISVERFEHLKRTLKAHPELLDARPVIATRGCTWAPLGTVIAGNMRLRAAIDLGWTDVPTVYVKLSEKKAREWMTLDNVPFGEWDEDLLAEHLYEHQQAGADMDLTGFSEHEWKRLVAGVAGLDPEPGPPPPPLDAPRTVTCPECNHEFEPT